MKNTQSGVFFYLALLCFLRFEAQPQRRWYALALVCGLAALLSKPSTVVLPLVLLLCAWWQRGRWQRADFVRVAPFFGLAIGMSALTVLEQRGHILREGTSEWKLGMAERLVIAGKAVWFYAAKLLWPSQLTFVYPRWELDTGSLWSWIPLAGLVAAGLVLWVRRRESWARASLFGCGCFVAALLPVLGFFDVYYFRYSYVADHFQYLAGAALVVLVTTAGAKLCEKAGRPARIIGAVGVTGILLVFGSLTWIQAGDYRDSLTLWRNTLAKNPGSWMVHANFGFALYETGKLDEAIDQYREALRIRPESPETHNDLALALAMKDKFDQAIAEYLEAVRLWPAYAEGHNNLGNALLHVGKTPEAIARFDLALQIKPDYAEAHNNLGNALMQSGRIQDAFDQYEQALRIKPEYADAHYNLGGAFARIGKVQEAISQFEQALRLDPGFAKAHNHLGLALMQTGRRQEAVAHFEQALRFKPEYADAHYNLANALMQTGQFQAAIEHYEAMLRIEPGSASAHNNLGGALFRVGRTQDAIRQFEEALRIKPDYAEAQHNLERVRAAQ